MVLQERPTTSFNEQQRLARVGEAIGPLATGVNGIVRVARAAGETVAIIGLAIGGKPEETTPQDEIADENTSQT